MFLACDTLTNQIADHSAKEKPPQVEGAIKTLKSKRLDVEAVRAEGPRGLPDSSARFSACHTKRVALQDANAHAAQRSLPERAHGDRSGERIAGVGAGHYFEEQAHIRNGARHGADNADPGKCSGTWREMSRSRHANRAAAIAANAAGRAASRNRCCFATARTSCGVRQIPRIARFPREPVVGLVSH